MSMNNLERLECLIERCNEVINAYNGLINKQEMPENFYRPWDNFMDALERIEEGMK